MKFLKLIIIKKKKSYIIYININSTIINNIKKIEFFLFFFNFFLNYYFFLFRFIYILMIKTNIIIK